MTKQINVSRSFWIGFLCLFSTSLSLGQELYSINILAKETLNPGNRVIKEVAFPLDQGSGASIAQDFNSQANAMILLDKGSCIEFPIVAVLKLENGYITHFRSECLSPMRNFGGTTTTDGPPNLYSREIHIRTPNDEYVYTEKLETTEIQRNVHFVMVKNDRYEWSGRLSTWVSEMNRANEYIDLIKKGALKVVDKGSFIQTNKDLLEIQYDKSGRWLTTNENIRFEFLVDFPRIASYAYRNPDVNLDYSIESIKKFEGSDDPFVIPSGNEVKVVTVKPE